MTRNLVHLVNPDISQLLGTDGLRAEYDAEVARRQAAHDGAADGSMAGRTSSVTPAVEDVLGTQELVQAYDDASAAIEAGHIVRSVRRKAGLSQTALARRLKITQARVSAIETGEGRDGPSYALLRRVAWACGTSLSALFSELPARKHPEVGVR